MFISIQVYALFITFILCLILGPIIISFLHRLNCGAVISKWGPQSHIKKTGTPIMGGLIFLIAMTVVGIFFSRQYKELLPMIFVTLGFGAVGLADDLIIILKKRSVGLTAGQKMLGLIAIATVFTFYILNSTDVDANIMIPFLSKEINLGWVYIPFTIFVLISMTNAVNLTDGLDGLATGVTLVVAVFFTIVAMSFEEYQYVMIFSSILAGGCLGFLAFNAHPAKVFMGDSGSLALGGAVAAIAIMMKNPLILLIVGGVYVAQALSVVIQVTSFKLTGKRVFKMSPLHHHFELSGWKETKIVWVFWTVTILLCIIGFISLRWKIL